jgi:hypothetical protein
MHQRRRMLPNPLQYIDEIIVGINVVQSARDQQALREAACLAPNSVQEKSQFFFLPIGITRKERFKG